MATSGVIPPAESKAGTNRGLPGFAAASSNSALADAGSRATARSDSPSWVSGWRRMVVWLSTVRRLGFGNVARVAVHRGFKRGGIYRVLAPRRSSKAAFETALGQNPPATVSFQADHPVLSEADELLSGRANYFSVHQLSVGNPPDWFLNPFQKTRHPYPDRHWSKIREFDCASGDIKAVWEMSRFTWAPLFARAWRISGDERYVSALRLWIEDWWWRNPANTGPNWICGQESAIRLINTLSALRVLGLERNAGPGWQEFGEAHCRRIDLTTFYALAQDNNHATSEAAGLFVGGTWLAKCGVDGASAQGEQWARKGRKLLERAVSRLILPDGSFSQHSLTYHRVLLDTLSMAECWRRSVDERPFAPEFYDRAVAATRWFKGMVDLQTGDGPNLGANDGAQPFRLHGAAYRDFRPCLQLATQVFDAEPALEPGPWDEPAAWLGVQTKQRRPRDRSESKSSIFADGGYVILRDKSGAAVLLRTPTAGFRPSHADALHLDLWWRGENLLRDGGSYCYADAGSVASSLASVTGHNVPQFDEHDQMPRLSRFLYGDWARTTGDREVTTSDDGQSWSGGYTDSWGAEHKRSVHLKRDLLRVTDELRGFKRGAVLRWRLLPGNWVLNGHGCSSNKADIRLESSVPIIRMNVASGWESRHYMEKSQIPVLEVEINQSPAVVTTTFDLF